MFSSKHTKLSLLEELSQTDTAVQQLLGGLIEIRAELGESSDLTVTGELELHGGSDLVDDRIGNRWD